MLAYEIRNTRRLDPSTPQGIYNIILAETNDKERANKISCEVEQQLKLQEFENTQPPA